MRRVRLQSPNGELIRGGSTALSLVIPNGAMGAIVSITTRTGSGYETVAFDDLPLVLVDVPQHWLEDV